MCLTLDPDPLPGRVAEGALVTQLIPLPLGHRDFETLFLGIVLELIQRHGDVIGPNAQHSTRLDYRHDLGRLLVPFTDGVSRTACLILGAVDGSGNPIGWVAERSFDPPFTLPVRTVGCAIDATIREVGFTRAGAACPDPSIGLLLQEALPQLVELFPAQLEVMHAAEVFSIGAVDVLPDQVIGGELVFQRAAFDHPDLLLEVLRWLHVVLPMFRLRLLVLLPRLGSRSLRLIRRLLRDRGSATDGTRQ
jgi:hypothetical protein